MHRGSRRVTVRRFENGLFECPWCLHQERNSRVMMVRLRPDLARAGPEPVVQAHVHNCIHGAPGRSAEQSLASIPAIEFRYRREGHRRVEVMTVDREPDGSFECPECCLRDGDTGYMGVGLSPVGPRSGLIPTVSCTSPPA
jgi:transcription elongation factor Elf1